MDIITRYTNGTAVYYDEADDTFITTKPTNCSWIADIVLETKVLKEAMDLAEVIDNEQEGYKEKA